MTRTIGVALLGLGNVGGGVVKLLEENAAAIRARLGAAIEIRAIVVRDPAKLDRVIEIDRARLTTDLLSVVKRAEIDVVCELIGGTTLAKEAVLSAIAAGKHVVTANKALLAEHGTEIFAAADQAQVEVYYEAAVCGGVPIIRVLREGLASDRVESLIGIVNGTSNYILSSMTETRRAFADVLAEAQKLGYAEADPTLDIGGGDAAHKLAILIGLVFGRVDVTKIPIDGIDVVDPIDLEYADKFGYVIKPLAIARERGAQVEARVHATLIPRNWLLADVAGAKNAVYVQSYALGPSMYYGAGAGMLPTAMSVVSDLIDLGRNILGPYALAAQAAGAGRGHRVATVQREVMPLSEVRTRYYLRFGVADEPGVLGRLMTILGAHHVSIAQVVQDTSATDGPVWVIVLTHEAKEGEVRAALSEIDKLPVVRDKARLIRIAS